MNPSAAHRRVTGSAARLLVCIALLGPLLALAAQTSGANPPPPLAEMPGWTPITTPRTELWAQGNADPAGDVIEVARHGWQDSSESARVGTIPFARAEPGQRFRAAVRMQSNVRFRAEIRFYQGSTSVLDTVTTASFVRGPTATSSVVGTAPAGTTNVSMRIHLDDVDYGERHRVAEYELWRKDRSSTVAPKPTTTTTTRPTPTTAAAAATTTTTRPRATMTAPPTTAPPPTAPTTTTPPPPPASSSWPGPANTGHGSLSKTSGGMTITRDGTVIDGYDVTGTINVQADNVVIRNTRIRHSGQYGVSPAESVDGLVVEDVTIIGTQNGCSAGIGPNGSWVLRRADISGCIDGIKARSNQRVQSNWVHGLRTGKLPDGSYAHNDALQSTSGSNVVIVGNNFEVDWRAGANAAVMMSSAFGTLQDYTLALNRFAGGQFVVSIRNQGHGDPRNILIALNTWDAGNWHYGPTNFAGTTVRLGVGNVYDSGDSL